MFLVWYGNTFVFTVVHMERSLSNSVYFTRGPVLVPCFLKLTNVLEDSTVVYREMLLIAIGPLVTKQHLYDVKPSEPLCLYPPPLSFIPHHPPNNQRFTQSPKQHSTWRLPLSSSPMSFYTLSSLVPTHTPVHKIRVNSGLGPFSKHRHYGSAYDNIPYLSILLISHLQMNVF